MNLTVKDVEHLRFFVDSIEIGCDFWSPGSISLIVKAGAQRGWIDVHFPSEGHIKVQMRGALPADLLKPEMVRKLIKEVLVHLEVPNDQTYEATFFKPLNVIRVQ